MPFETSRTSCPTTRRHNSEDLKLQGTNSWVFRCSEDGDSKLLRIVGMKLHGVTHERPVFFFSLAWLQWHCSICGRPLDTAQSASFRDVLVERFWPVLASITWLLLVAAALRAVCNVQVTSHFSKAAYCLWSPNAGRSYDDYMKGAEMGGTCSTYQSLRNVWSENWREGVTR
jgi:hypothetical protein